MEGPASPGDQEGLMCNACLDSRGLDKPNCCFPLFQNSATIFCRIRRQVAIKNKESVHVLLEVGTLKEGMKHLNNLVRD